MLMEWQGIGLHLAYGTMLLGLAGTLWVERLRMKAIQKERDRERCGREEMEAYLRLDVRMRREGDLGSLGARVSRVIAARSPFGRVMMLAATPGGSYRVAGREGVEDALAAAAECAVRILAEGRWSEGKTVGEHSLIISLGEGRAVVVPIGPKEGRTLGALVVCADSIQHVPQQLADKAVVGLEALASKLARAMETGDSGRFLRRTVRTEHALKVVSGATDPSSGKDRGTLRDRCVPL